MAQRWQRLGLVASAVVAGALLLGGQPAAAAPSAPDPGASAPPPVASTQPGVAPPAPPSAVSVPGRGKVAPFTSKLAPIGPKALPGVAKTKGNALDPAKSRAPGSTPRRAAQPNAGPDDPYNLFCDERVTPSVNPSGGNVTNISYTAEVGCNFYLYYGYGAAAIVDRTPGYDGTFLQFSNPFEFYNNYYAATSGGLQIFGDVYLGGRQVEIVFELYLITPYGIPWVACNPLVNLRYLVCDGLGTDLLHIVVGTGSFNTGLGPAKIGYTSLGDSFSSGTGGAPYFGLSECRRSDRAYPFVIAGRPTITGRPIDQPVHRACHGAVIPDLYASPNEVNPQLVDVTASTDLVTLTIGGNDLGFEPKLKACILFGCPKPLVSDTELLVTKIELIRLYQNIRARMDPNGYLFVLSYPQFMPDPDEGEVPDFASCFGTNLAFSVQDLRDIAEGTRRARNMIREAVEATVDFHVRFVDMIDVFRGHRVCSPEEWSTGFKFPELGASFHPNPRGHQAIAERLYREMLPFF